MENILWEMCGRGEGRRDFNAIPPRGIHVEKQGRTFRGYPVHARRRSLDVDVCSCVGVFPRDEELRVAVARSRLQEATFAVGLKGARCVAEAALFISLGAHREYLLVSSAQRGEETGRIEVASKESQQLLRKFSQFCAEIAERGESVAHSAARDASKFHARALAVASKFPRNIPFSLPSGERVSSHSASRGVFSIAHRAPESELQRSGRENYSSRKHKGVKKKGGGEGKREKSACKTIRVVVSRIRARWETSRGQRLRMSRVFG